MSKSEKKVIVAAIADLMADDGDFTGAIQRLCSLVGMNYPAGTVLPTLKPVDIAAIASGENRTFSVRPKP